MSAFLSRLEANSLGEIRGYPPFFFVYFNSPYKDLRFLHGNNLAQKNLCIQQVLSFSSSSSCLSYPGGLGSSTILGDLDNSKYLGKLITYLDPALPSASRAYFERCWHAKTDGWNAAIFHSNCDGKGPTVTIIKVGQYIFGGYTDASWQSTCMKWSCDPRSGNRNLSNCKI